MSDSKKFLHLAFIEMQNKIPPAFLIFEASKDALQKRIRDFQSEKSDKSEENEKFELRTNKSFSNLLGAFRTSLSGYRQAIFLYLSIGPVFATQQLHRRAKKLIKSKGSLYEPLEGVEYATLPMNFFNELKKHLDEFNELFQFSSELPGILLVGLTSTYDDYVAQLIDLILDQRPDLVERSEKQLSFKQIMEFESLEHAKEFIKKHQIDDIMRDSRLKQITWIKEKLNLNIDWQDPIWSEFCEICERRNLFTHAGGRATKQYLENCAKQNVDIKNVQLDDSLTVDPRYLRRAVDVYFEVGIKLGIIVWRHLHKDQCETADSEISDICYQLIVKKRYKLAQRMLIFAKSMPSISSDRQKKTYIINLANAYKLDEQFDKANSELEKVDWSSASDDFGICVAAIKDDLPEVTKIMKAIGPNGSVSRQSYLEWPVIQTIRSSSAFRETYEEVFAAPLEQDEVTMQAERAAKTEERLSLPPIG